MPTHTIEVDTVLFDMDGTLIDSTPAVNGTWRAYCDRFHLDYDHVQESAHGYRTVENLRRFISREQLPEEDIPAEVVKFETMIADLAKERQGREGGIVALPGTTRLLEQITSQPHPSHPLRKPGWAIVTSATRAYATVGFAASQSSPSPPDVFVTSDLVSRGKPAPDPYLLGAKLSGVDATRCLVVEDAPPGVRAGKAAGARVLGLGTTHDKKRMWEAGADFVCQDLSCVAAEWKEVDGEEGEGKVLRLMLTIEGEERPAAQGEGESQ